MKNAIIILKESHIIEGFAVHCIRKSITNYG